MTKKTVGVGVIGSGFIGRTHTNAYKKISYLFTDTAYAPRLAALCDVPLEQAKQQAERFGYATAFDDWEQLVRSPDVDAVDVCVPDQFHKAAALAAIAAGKNVLCEKPMALSAGDAREMAIAAARAGVVNMASFNYRFMPAVRLAYNMIQSGELGSPRHMYVQYFQQGGADETTAYDDLWYKLCGALQGIGTHAIDQTRFLFGEIESLSGLTGTPVPERKTKDGKSVKTQVEENSAALLKFANGATGLLECSVVSWGRRNRLYWEIYCSKGSLRFDLEEPNVLEVYLGEQRGKLNDGFAKLNVTGNDYPFANRWWPEGHNLGWEHAHIHLIDHYLTCVATGNPVSPLGATFEDGFKAAVVVDAIREASQSGARIELADRFRLN